LPARYLGAKAEALCFGLFVSARLRSIEMAAASAAFPPQRFSSAVFQNGAISTPTRSAGAKKRHLDPHGCVSKQAIRMPAIGKLSLQRSYPARYDPGAGITQMLY